MIVSASDNHPLKCSANRCHVEFLKVNGEVVHSRAPETKAFRFRVEQKRVETPGWFKRKWRTHGRRAYEMDEEETAQENMNVLTKSVRHSVPGESNARTFIKSGVIVLERAGDHLPLMRGLSTL